MNAPSQPGRRLRIDRLELDLRGIAPATAEAAARLLGPALAKALAQSAAQEPAQAPAREPAQEQALHQGFIAPAGRIDAGRIASPASPGAHDLAAGIAQRIAHSVRRENS